MMDGGWSMDLCLGANGGPDDRRTTSSGVEKFGGKQMSKFWRESGKWREPILLTSRALAFWVSCVSTHRSKAITTDRRMHTLL